MEPYSYTMFYPYTPWDCQDGLPRNSQKPQSTTPSAAVSLASPNRQSQGPGRVNDTHHPDATPGPSVTGRLQVAQGFCFGTGRAVGLVGASGGQVQFTCTPGFRDPQVPPGDRHGPNWKTMFRIPTHWFSGSMVKFHVVM